MLIGFLLKIIQTARTDELNAKYIEFVKFYDKNNVIN